MTINDICRIVLVLYSSQLATYAETDGWLLIYEVTVGDFTWT